MKFYYVYVLRSKRYGRHYTGFTTNLRKRLARHNNGEVPSTKPYKPWELVFYEAYRNSSDAKRREKYLKTTKGKTTLKTMLSDFFKEHS